MNGAPIIITRALTKEYRLGHETVVALHDVSLTIGAGEYWSIMGPSGSGKSTLFNLVGALDKPTRGEVLIEGVELGKLTERQRAYFRGNRIGYVFQSYNLLAAYTALDNVAFPLIFAGARREAAHARAREMLEQVGLGERLDHRPEELSGGQQQRVAIARALANRPRIVLADEPTANLDLHTGEEIIALLQTLCRREGVTVISATHDHKMLAASDRIVWMRDGVVERVQTAAEASVNQGRIESLT